MFSEFLFVDAISSEIRAHITNRQSSVFRVTVQARLDMYHVNCRIFAACDRYNIMFMLYRGNQEYLTPQSW